jgi:propanol-preferring alcohol dehydrogenase
MYAGICIYYFKMPKEKFINFMIIGCFCNFLSLGSFPCPIFDIVLKGITIKGSIVGSRLDCHEALDFGARGLVKAVVEIDELENIADVFDRLHAGKINGRVVIKMD